MSYIDAYLDKNTNLIQVIEKEGKKQKNVSFPAQYVYYYEDPNGSYTSMWGIPCKKVVHNTYKAFQKDLSRAIASGKKIHESDINPVFRCLDDNYRDEPLPDLNIGFFDIEVDFSMEKGFAPVDDPFNRITAISIYITDEDKIYTFVMKPDLPENDKNYLSYDEADKICSEFTDCYLCDSEEQLFKCFLEVIEKVDILSGWNCLSGNSSIFLKDRIKKLPKIIEGDTSIIGDKILKTHSSGKKELINLTLSNGSVIETSGEHKYPVFIKSKNKHTNVNQILKSEKVITADDINNIMSDNDVYLKMDMSSHNNKSLTWKKYLIENINTLIEYEWFDFIIPKEFRNFYNKNEISNVFERAYYRYNDSQWNYKKHKEKISNIIDIIKNVKTLTFKFKNKNPMEINIDEVISNDFLQYLGFVFTDGFYSKYDKHVSICNKRLDVIDFYSQIVKSKYSMKKQDLCYYSVTNNKNIFLLLPMIYDNNWKKTISVELLSQLSIEQFAAFYSGCIDGDGSVTDSHMTLCEYQDNSHNIQELLSWNGVYSNRSDHVISIAFDNHSNKFINMIHLSHRDKMNNLLNRKVRKLKSTPSKKLRKFYIESEKSYYVKIKRLDYTNTFIDMYDIMTETQYFVCNGVKVHNSTFFDIPYLINRLKKILPKHYLKELCHWNQEPQKKKIMKFGKEHETYELKGRIHLDYLDLYRKHNTKEQHSYTLDHIGEIETGERKVQYDGSLDLLYKTDFRKFIDYNRQDVMLLHRIDQKRKYIQLSNQIAHQNCVLFPTTMGSVALVEQAITHEVHSRGMIVPSKNISYEENESFEYFDAEDDDSEEDDDYKKKDEDIPAIGAYVAKPKTGIHNMVGAVDVNSLYPSTIRSLNMSLETVFGQARTTYTDKFVEERLKQTKANFVWNDVFCCVEYQLIMDRTKDLITFDFIDNESIALTAEEWHDFIFNEESNFILSANGTLFRKDIDGVIPKLLEKWYANRKELRAKSEVFGKLQSGIQIPDDLLDMLKGE